MELSGKCAACKVDSKTCGNSSKQPPAYCSAIIYAEALVKASAEYEKAEVFEFARKAEKQRSEGCAEKLREPRYRFTVKTRVQRLIDFLQEMEYQRIGLAFCAGLCQEAAVIARLFENNGFEVVSVVCDIDSVNRKVEGNQNSKYGSNLPRCNSIAQAEVLNQAGTEFNLLLGLCVGNESLFIKYSKAMVSVFAVDDMALGLNPLAGALLCAPSRHDQETKNIGVTNQPEKR